MVAGEEEETTERAMFEISLEHHIRNQGIRKHAGVDDIITRIARLK